MRDNINDVAEKKTQCAVWSLKNGCYVMLP
jgi:hypothetical protein